MTRLVYLITILFVFYQIYLVKCNQNNITENFDTTSIEQLNTLAGQIMQNGELVIPSAKIGNLTVDNKANIGNVTIQSGRILCGGMEGAGDLHIKSKRLILHPKVRTEINSFEGGTGDFIVTGASNINGKLTVPNAKIGEWEIRENKIGIPGRADMNVHTDGYLRLLQYDQQWDGAYTVNGIAANNYFLEGAGDLRARLGV